jgi:hypothetical protein
MSLPLFELLAPPAAEPGADSVAELLLALSSLPEIWTLWLTSLLSSLALPESLYVFPEALMEPVLALPAEPVVPVALPVDPAPLDADEPDPIDAFAKTNSLAELLDAEPGAPGELGVLDDADALAGCRQPVNVMLCGLLLLRGLLPSCPGVDPDVDGGVWPGVAPAWIAANWADTPKLSAAVNIVPKISCRFIQNLLGHRYPIAFNHGRCKLKAQCKRTFRGGKSRAGAQEA